MFKFINLQYAETNRGVHCWGDIEMNGVPAGTFSQEPFCACITGFTSIGARNAFLDLAVKLGMSITELAGQVLTKSEEAQISQLESND